MHLSGSLGVSSDTPWVRKHNAEAQAVVAAWRADKPIRVPLLCPDSFAQHGIYADRAAVDYERYYGEPEEMVRVQLEAARLRRELPIYDLVLGEAPASWPITVDFWPVPAPGWVGCEVTYRKHAVPAHRPLNLSREECDAIYMPDPRNGGILEHINRFAEDVRKVCAGLTFLGKPVGPVSVGVDHYGVLAMALDVRGPELLADLQDEPDFARRFLLKMAEWCDALERVWKHEPGKPLGYFRQTDHGIDMLSAATYEEFIVPVILEINRRRGTSLPTGLHHCGRGAHIFPVMKKYFPLQRMDDLTFPLLDIAKVRRDVGADVRVTVVIEDSIIQLGPPERIRQTVKDLMDSGAKGRGRMALSVGDMLPGTPMEHRAALYAAVKEFGGYA